jgi:selenium metabolism protein YedF
MANYVDARGLACPQPVIATKKALDSIDDGTVTVIVDNAIAKENVLKLAVSSHCEARVEEKNGLYTLQIVKGSGSNQAEPLIAVEAASATVYLITKNTLGHGNDELGGVLIKSLLFTLVEKQPHPKTVMFINSGVLLTTQGSPVLEHLQKLEQAGVQLLSCGTCLEYYQLKDKLAVGGVTNMYTILDEMSANKAITL